MENPSSLPLPLKDDSEDADESMLGRLSYEELKQDTHVRCLQVRKWIVYLQLSLFILFVIQTSDIENSIDDEDMNVASYKTVLSTLHSMHYDINSLYSDHGAILLQPTCGGNLTNALPCTDEVFSISLRLQIFSS